MSVTPRPDNVHPQQLEIVDMLKQTVRCPGCKEVVSIDELLPSMFGLCRECENAILSIQG